jgi:hypothetical protein
MPDTTLDSIVDAAVDTLNTAHGLIAPIVSLGEEITLESLTGAAAWHHAEAMVALAEKAGSILERGIKPLYEARRAARLESVSSDTADAGGGIESENGAGAARALLRAVGQLGNETLAATDRRDYSRMAWLIEDSIRENVTEADTDTRHGFLLALADLLCANADGCHIDPDTWDPLTTICREQREGALS